MKKVGIALASTFEIVFITLLGFVFGKYIDEEVLKTNLIFTSVVTLICMSYGFYRLYKNYTKNE